MPAPRHHHIDLLKVLAILLVVLGHSIQFTQSLYQDRIAFQVIYSFHMHLFFFASGILASGSALGARLRSHAATLLVPFVAWMPIYWSAERVLRIAPDLGGLTAHILATFAAPSLGLWFLWVLFLIHLVHAALQATLASVGAQVATLAAAVQAVGAGQSIDPAVLTAAAEAGARKVLADIGQAAG